MKIQLVISPELARLAGYLGERVEDASRALDEWLADEMYRGHGLLDAKGKPIRAQEPLGLAAWLPAEPLRGDR